MVGLSAGERQFIHGGIAQDLRSDGRQRLQFRPISVQTGVIPQVLMMFMPLICFGIFSIINGDVCFSFHKISVDFSVHLISFVGFMIG